MANVIYLLKFLHIPLFGGSYRAYNTLEIIGRGVYPRPIISQVLYASNKDIYLILIIIIGMAVWTISQESNYGLKPNILISSQIPIPFEPSKSP